MTYQGKLTDSNGQPITTPVNVTFTFRDAEMGGNLLGNGFSDIDAVVPDSSGVVTTDIGDDPGNPIPLSVFVADSVWLNVNVGGNDLPRTRVTPAAIAINALPLFGEAYVIAEVTATDPMANGANLIAAYNRAKALTPHGDPPNLANRACLFIPPGKYDMGTTQLLVDTPFVDLVGMSSIREDQHIFGTSNGPGTGVVRLSGIVVNIENLFVECTRSAGPLPNDSAGPAAYFPDSGTTDVTVRNCAFKGSGFSYSMRLGVAYAGHFTDCSAGDGGYGGKGSADGTFVRCNGGNGAFGGEGGSARGTFTHCTAGDNSFGAAGFAGGTYNFCIGGNGAFAGNGGNTANGTFTNCVGGSDSFGGGGGLSFGIYTNCQGGDGAFGGKSDLLAMSGSASGIFTNCVGGNQSFGGHNGSATGKFTHCIGGLSAFAGPSGNGDGGRFFYCFGSTDSFTTQPAFAAPRGTTPPIHRFCLVNGTPFP